MKKKQTKKIVILILLVVLIVGGIVAVVSNKKEQEEQPQNEVNRVVEEFVQVLEDGTKLNTSDKLQQTKTIDGLEITNIQLTEQNGQTVLLADVKNPTGQDKGVIGINIVILDKAGNEIAKVPGVIAPTKAGETKQLNVGITEDYANAYDFKVEKQ